MFTPQELEMLICGEKVTLWFHSTPAYADCWSQNILDFHSWDTYNCSSGVWFQWTGEFHRVWWWLQSADSMCWMVWMIHFWLSFSRPTHFDGSKDEHFFHRFWEAVHSMALEDKRKLLQFTTGRLVFQSQPNLTNILVAFYSKYSDFYLQRSDPCWRTCQTETDHCKEWPRLWQVPLFMCSMPCNAMQLAGFPPLTPASMSCSCPSIPPRRRWTTCSWRQSRSARSRSTYT